jgi:hypothetical protein
MKVSNRQLTLAIFLTVALVTAAGAQLKTNFEVLTGTELAAIMPKGFYFAGLSAETQMRNSAAAKIGENRFILAGLVDTSGYSTDIQGVYEGFFITDSPIRFGSRTLGTGAYGFGFSDSGKVNVFDLSSRQILSVSTSSDAELKRPRPLLMVAESRGIRLYKGRNYVLIAPR